jgi:hypothetical protein
MRTTVLLCVGWTLLAALPAHAELKGVQLYERGKYAAARKALEDELRSNTLTQEDRVKARLYLAAALFASKAPEVARIQLEELMVTAPDVQVDPILFPPDFVAMAQDVRKQLEQQRMEKERQRLEAERQRLEAERKAREEELARNKQPPPEEHEEEPPRGVRLRPELFGFVAPLGKGVGVGGAFTLAFSSVDVSARVLGGANIGVGAELGFLLGEGNVQPRVGLRATAVPQLSGFGGGAVAGIRVAASERLSLLLDVGAEYLKLSPKPEDMKDYRSFVLTGSAGVGFDLF